MYSVACGLLLLGFTMIEEFLRFAFSLGAFLLGLRFFSQYETWGIRLTMVLASVGFFLIFVIVYTAVAYVRGWPIPGMDGSV